MIEQAVTVYVVDDSPLEREAIRKWLKEVGIDSVPLDSGKDFVYECRGDGPVVAVLDMHMNFRGDDTYTVMHLRGLGWVPTIFVSNTTDVDLVGKLLRAGAMDFMTKRMENKERLQLAVKEAMLKAEAIYSAGREGMALSPLSTLSRQQIEIWKIFTKQGLRKNVDIGKVLGVSGATVSTQKARMFAKLKISSMEQIAAKYGDIDLEQLYNITTGIV